MGRWRRPGADEILLVFMLLATIGFICSWLSHIYVPQNPWPFLSTLGEITLLSSGVRLSFGSSGIFVRQSPVACNQPLLP